jgi:protein-S-isoprenylcysteine O-methyltransferase Ste14
MLPFYQHATKIAWLLLGLYWLWSSRRIKAVSHMEAPFKRFVAYHLPMLAACALLGEGEWYGDTWLHHRFLSELVAFQPAGLVLVAGGVFIACWARHTLGRNWSVAPQLKHEHEFVQSGPYRHVRHPIYSGLLLAFLGTTVMIGEWRALLAFAIVLASFAYKYRVEERLLQRHFGDRYRRYAARTGALLPWAG